MNKNSVENGNKTYFVKPPIGGMTILKVIPAMLSSDYKERPIELRRRLFWPGALVIIVAIIGFFVPQEYLVQYFLQYVKSGTVANFGYIMSSEAYKNSWLMSALIFSPIYILSGIYIWSHLYRHFFQINTYSGRDEYERRPSLFTWAALVPLAGTLLTVSGVMGSKGAENSLWYDSQKVATHSNESVFQIFSPNELLMAGMPKNQMEIMKPLLRDTTSGRAPIEYMASKSMYVANFPVEQRFLVSDVLYIPLFIGLAIFIPIWVSRYSLFSAYAVTHQGEVIAKMPVSEVGLELKKAGERLVSLMGRFITLNEGGAKDKENVVNVLEEAINKIKNTGGDEA